MVSSGVLPRIILACITTGMFLSIIGCEASSDNNSSSQAATTSQAATSQPQPTPTVEPDTAMVARLEAKANDSLGTYVTLHDEAEQLVANAPVLSGQDAMDSYNGSNVDPWRTKELQFQHDITTNVPTIPDLAGRTTPQAARSRSLILGVFANLGVADNMMSSAMTDLMTVCNSDAANLELKAADEAAHLARQTIDGQLTANDQGISAQEPDYIANLDTSNKCDVGAGVSSQDTTGGGSGAPDDSGGLAQFDDEDSAQAHCPDDTVVWLNLDSGIYHYKGERWYGNTENGAYVCEQEAIASGDRATENGQ